MEGTPVCATGRSPQRYRWLRGHGSNVTSWFRPGVIRFHHLALVWTGDSNLQPAGSWTSLIPDPPQCDGVTGRTRTGFLRAHIPACRPLQLRPPSTREESNLRPPPCGGGGLPLTYSSLVGRAPWSRTTSSRVISAVPSPSGSRPQRGPRSARISSGRVSTAAPPSELQDHVSAREPGDRRCTPLRVFT